MTAEFSYADPEQPPAAELSFDVSGGGGFWDEATWNQFYWSAAAEGTAKARIDGGGSNISVTVLHASTYEDPHVLHGMTINYSMRGLKR